MATPRLRYPNNPPAEELFKVAEILEFCPTIKSASVTFNWFNKSIFPSTCPQNPPAFSCPFTIRFLKEQLVNVL